MIWNTQLTCNWTLLLVTALCWGLKLVSDWLSLSLSHYHLYCNFILCSYHQLSSPINLCLWLYLSNVRAVLIRYKPLLLIVQPDCSVFNGQWTVMNIWGKICLDQAHESGMLFGLVRWTRYSAWCPCQARRQNTMLIHAWVEAGLNQAPMLCKTLANELEGTWVTLPLSSIVCTEKCQPFQTMMGT